MIAAQSIRRRCVATIVEKEHCADPACAARFGAAEGDMAKQMEGKVCVITGGAGSIGLASAKLLYAEGSKVMLTDQNEAALK